MSSLHNNKIPFLREFSNKLSHKLVFFSIFPLLSGCEGCDSETRTRSVIDQFKIVAITTDPPEISYINWPEYDSVSMKALVVDPENIDGQEIEYLWIACTSFEGVIGCLEEVELISEEDLDDDNIVFTQEDYINFFKWFTFTGQMTMSGTTAEITGSFLPPFNEYYILPSAENENILHSLYLLVCRKNECPIIKEIESIKQESSALIDAEKLLETISDPELLVGGLPVDGVALAKKSYKTSYQDEPNLNHNPTKADIFDIDCQDLILNKNKQQCSLSVSTLSKNFETYEDPNTSSKLIQEGGSLRFFTTSGSINPTFVQINNSTTVQYITITYSSNDEIPEFLDIVSVISDSRYGADYSYIEIKK